MQGDCDCRVRNFLQESHVATVEGLHRHCLGRGAGVLSSKAHPEAGQESCYSMTHDESVVVKGWKRLPFPPLWVQ